MSPKQLTRPKIRKLLRKRKISRFRTKPIRSRKKTFRRIKEKTRIRDPFGNVLFLRRALTSVLAMATYPRLNIINKTKVEGSEYLMKLPKTNVLFISNHQTYYADVFALFHIFCSVKWKFKNINLPLYLLLPRVRSYYIAAEETMKESGLLPKIFSYAGAVTVKRSWRYKGKDVDRTADMRAPAKIKKALEFGWVVTFPQGTTTPGAPVRRGAANLIKSFNPIVVPVEISGFNQAFDKRGLKFKEKGVKLSVRFKEPKQFTEDATVDEIHAFLEGHILREKMV